MNLLKLQKGHTPMFESKHKNHDHNLNHFLAQFSLLARASLRGVECATLDSMCCLLKFIYFVNHRGSLVTPFNHC
jgi:hypothetical protein